MLQLGLESFDFVLERPWIDLEQQIPFLHQCTVGEGDTFNLPRHTRTDLDRFRRFQTRGDFVPFGDRLFDHLGDGNVRRPRCFGDIGRTIASGEHREGQCGKGITKRFE
ncbi:hypothetical protein D3C85_1025650 [compost metagenome]